MQALRQFEAHLERILPSTAEAAELRTRVAHWLAERAAHVQATEKRLDRQSVVPWSAAAERAYTAEVEVRARFIVQALLRGGDESATVLEQLAEVYAHIATYRGNVSAQVTTGTVEALMPLSLIFALTFYAPQTYPINTIVIGADFGEAIYYWSLTIVGSLATYSAGVFATAAFPRGRKFLRSIGYREERRFGARRIERAFWNRLREDLGQHRQLKAYLPTTPDADFPTFFFTRLNWAGRIKAQCEAMLAKSPKGSK